jgi:hypothetical protein
VPGQFGENFTVEGLPDDAVCIGDRVFPYSGVHGAALPRDVAGKADIDREESTRGSHGREDHNRAIGTPDRWNRLGAGSVTQHVASEPAMNLNQVTLPARDLEPAVQFYRVGRGDG